jgi:hypothetical protein
VKLRVGFAAIGNVMPMEAGIETFESRREFVTLEALPRHAH